VLGGIEVFPLATGVILQVVEGVVSLGFDCYVLGKRFFIRERDSRNERKQGDHAHKECKDFGECLSHGGIGFLSMVRIFEQ